MVAGFRPAGPLGRRLSSPALLLLALAGLSLPASAQELEAAAAGACRSMGPSIVLGVCAITLFGTLVALVALRRRLDKEGWSLANALSEPTRLTIPIDPRWSQSQGDNLARMTQTSGAGVVTRSSSEPGASDGAPVALTILEASSSRLIAIVGMVVILLMYLGFGVFALYTFGLTCQMPATTASVTSFLYAGLTLFAPYAANKVSGILKPALGGSSGGGAASGSDSARVSASVPGSAPGAGQGTTAGAAPSAAPGVVGVAAEPAPAIAAHPAAPGAIPSPSEAMAATTAMTTATTTAATAATVHRSTPAPAGDPYGPAVALIIEFEGFVDHAYPDPASGGEPWTIGYGFTTLNGRPVRPGDTLSQSEARSVLNQGVSHCASHLGGTIPYWSAMADDQRCALISFAWNLGEGFYGSDGFDTLSRRLREKDWAAVPDALLLYCNPGSAVAAGLLRRRQAEADLWRQGMSGAGAGNSAGAAGAAAGAAPAGASASPKATSPSAAAAANATAAANTNANATATATANGNANANANAKGAHPNPLNVPWFDQLQMDDGQGWRDCFSASSAMLAAYWGKEPNEDDYNTLRQKYGDSTSSEAQLAALRHLGLQAQFRTDGSLDSLRAEIDAGRPVAVGWLHHGPPSAPSGGGHWTVVIGYDATGVIMNDPYGSCDLVNGGYPANHNGARQHYSYANWEPRWRPQGSGGWMLCAQP